MESQHLSREELDAGLENILQSPKSNGVLSMIVQRPDINERNEVEVGNLSVAEGLIGDNWKARGSRMTADRSAHPDMQLNIMNTRAIELIAQDRSRWPLAGDQLYIDLDLSLENLPAGTRLQVGEAVVQVTDIPHRGCLKFVERFGRDAMEFVNSELGCQLNLRGINAKVVQGGEIRITDPVKVIRN